jgi:hypothetical protein
MAAGIGTEFAFKNHKVRYLSLDALLEFAVNATEACFLSRRLWANDDFILAVGPVAGCHH